MQVAPGDIYTTVITVEEQIKGWYKRLHLSNRPQDIEDVYRRLAETVQFYSRVSLVNYEAAAVNRFLQLKQLKLNIGANDLRIASIALEESAIVVTRNIRDFSRVPGLTVEDWSQ